jgi:hypothetical protein
MGRIAAWRVMIFGFPQAKMFQKVDGKGCLVEFESKRQMPVFSANSVIKFIFH